MQKHPKWKQNSLSRKIVSLTVFLDALFLVIVMAVMAFIYLDNLDKTQIARMESEMTNAVESIDSFVEHTLMDLDEMATDDYLIAYLNNINSGMAPIITDPLDPNYTVFSDFSQEIQSVLKHSYEEIYRYIFVATTFACGAGDDGCYVGSGNDVSDIDWSLSERPWFQDLANQEKTISSPYVDALTGKHVITFVSTVKDDAQLIGYVGIDVLVEDLPKILSVYSEQDNEQKEFVLFHMADSPIVLHHSNPQLSDYVMLSGADIHTQDIAYGYTSGGLAEVASAIDVNQERIELQYFGVNHYVKYQSVEHSDWVVSISMETLPALRLELTFLALVAGTMLLMLLVSLVLSNKIHKTLSPIGDILDSIEEIKSGNYNIHVKVKENNELKHVADAINIMSQEIGKQVELVYQSFVFDTTTGLKNRKASHQEIDDILTKESEKMAVCLLEIDNIKSINVTKGQNVSEELLKGIAERLKRTVLNRDLIFANGGNEFLFLIPSVRSLERVEIEINKILDRFQDPIDIQNIKVEVKINVGISVYPSDGRSIVDLIKKCDTALFKARGAGSGKYVFYNEQLTKEVSYKAQVSEQLAIAIRNEQLYLKYQPLIDNKNEIYGFEALVRWKSPTLGEISPQIFVANAEESHLIIPLGYWILRQACKAQVEMKKQFDKKFVMSVNVSPVQLLQKDFIDVLKQIIRETEIDPHFLVLEITEGVLIESSILLEEIIDYLHEVGAKIALDDFGTGYASLTYLKQIPFDNLKIDKSFVDGIFGPKKDHSIIGTIVQLVHSLDMKVIAEGVEKRKQYEYLKQISTDVFQGFLFSKPLIFDDAVHYIDQFYKVAKNKRIDVFAGKDFYE